MIAEGIERIEQLNHLRALNCEYGQGNYFSVPLSAADFTDWLRDDSTHEREPNPRRLTCFRVQCPAFDPQRVSGEGAAICSQPITLLSTIS